MRFIKPINLTDKSFILDVRSPEEYASETIALPHTYKDLRELDPLEFIRDNNLTKDRTIYILCASGGRASQAAELFEQKGFDNVTVIIGGIVEAEYEGLKIIRN
ncbi:MAG: rhodanese-like domain-containing protein [Alphaproteobacteria bacterium]|nr:rhodanese-like domain-containing protein [Alphaproteobacteria bacterium]